MRVLIDTNVLISASLFTGSVPYKAYMKAVTSPFHGIICDQIIDEMKKVYSLKFPHKVKELNKFFMTAMGDIEIVNVPYDGEQYPGAFLIRDEKDRGIYEAAVKYKADIILTGDKDFLESGVDKPLCVSPSDFLENY